MMTTLSIGIMPWEKNWARILAAARGEFRLGPNEPKVWFTSRAELQKVVNDENVALLRLITKAQPGSIDALAQLTGRDAEELTRILQTLANCRIVQLKRRHSKVRPIVKASDFRIIDYSAIAPCDAAPSGARYQMVHGLSHK